jgi:non-specific serine/threonine protein kinase
MEAMQRKIATLASQAAAAAAAPAPRVVLRRDGDMWMLAHGGTRVHLRDRRGLHYLVSLLREPGREFHVLDLAGASRDLGGDLGPGLDGAAKQAIAARLRALRAELEDAEQANDPARAGAARAEIDQLGEYVAGAVGLGGRDRRVHAASERARASVTKALRAAIQQIGEHHPALAGELRAAGRTGTFCTYEPDKSAAERWEV